MLENGEIIVSGVKIALQLFSNAKAYICVEDNKMDAIEHLKTLCKDVENVEVVTLQTKYPQGGEKSIVKAVLNKEIPAGKLESQEETALCAFRELEEETNNRAKDMKFIMKFLPTPGYTSEWLYMYEAIDFEEVDDALAADEDEFIDVIYMDLDEAYEKVINGTIVDAKTIIAIMYAYNKEKK